MPARWLGGNGRACIRACDTRLAAPARSASTVHVTDAPQHSFRLFFSHYSRSLTIVTIPRLSFPFFDYPFYPFDYPFPRRTEDDPHSEAILKARQDTFAGLWPLDTKDGFPSIEQIAAAGWYYDPSEETPDGVTCPLFLSVWDAGDDPMEEHQRAVSSSSSL
jgi:hypothetical protein